MSALARSYPARPTLPPHEWLRVVERTPQLRTVLRPKVSPYSPHQPHPTQSAFLIVNHIREVLFGGSAGGGKSDALLMAALQYVDVPNYAALLLRRTTSDHKLPGSIMDRAQTWLAGSDARWRERDKTFVFPSGAKIVFGFLENEQDKYRYASAEFQFVGFDELTQFTQTQYTFMFSRMRRLKGSRVPIRMRGATNPIGFGAEWVRERWGIGHRKDAKQAARIFIPSKITDNPSIDRQEYEETLAELDPLTRAQLLDGNWEVRPNGGKFRREFFRLVDIMPAQLQGVVRYWDLASGELARQKDEPDWTVGCLMGRDNENRVIILDIERFRAAPGEVERRIKATAQADGRGVKVRMSQDPGQAGVAQIDHYSRFVLAAFDFEGVRESGDKAMRGDILAAKAYRGEVLLRRARWNNDFLDEVEMFPLGSFDDQIDAAEGARKALFEAETGLVRSFNLPQFGRANPDSALSRRQIQQQIAGGSRAAKRRRR